MTRKTILILTLAHLFISSGTHASEPLRQPEMFSYNDEGVTQGTIRAAWSTVMVGDSQYESLVFNDKYDSPLIRTRPGGVIKLTLDNQMAEKTALHFHGMQVSPLGHGDNIFKIIEPSESWEFEIELPSDHPPGMYWYHSHFNKGSQRQVNGGIAGAIMVDGMLDPFPELQGLQAVSYTHLTLPTIYSV